MDVFHTYIYIYYTSIATVTVSKCDTGLYNYGKSFTCRIHINDIKLAHIKTINQKLNGSVKFA